jgi:hypothetical protein
VRSTQARRNSQTIAAGLASFGGALPYAPWKLGLEAWGRTTRRLARMCSFTSLASRKLAQVCQSTFEQRFCSSKDLSGAARRAAAKVGDPRPCACEQRRFAFSFSRGRHGNQTQTQDCADLRDRVQRASKLSASYRVLMSKYAPFRISTPRSRGSGTCRPRLTLHTNRRRTRKDTPLASCGNRFGVAVHHAEYRIWGDPNYCCLFCARSEVHPYLRRESTQQCACASFPNLLGVPKAPP